jgi:hypothetical protein
VAALQGVVLAPLRFGPGDHVVRPRLLRCGEKGQAIDFKSDGAFWSHTIEGCWWREGERVTIAHPCLKHGVPPGAPIPALADASYTCRVKAGKVLRASECIRAGEYRPVP